MSRFIDFDQMWAESMPKEGDRPKIKVLGEEVSLPATLPARMLLWGMRMSEGDRPDFPTYSKEVLAQLSTLVGAEKVEEWIDKGIGFAQLDQILGHAYGLYAPSKDEDDDENPTKPEKGKKKGTPSKRSSKSGS